MREVAIVSFAQSTKARETRNEVEILMPVVQEAVKRSKLPRQEIGLLRQQAAYQNLAFNVWHALVAHRPLGGINHVRRAAYPISAAWRQQPAARR